LQSAQIKKSGLFLESKARHQETESLIVLYISPLTPGGGEPNSSGYMATAMERKENRQKRKKKPGPRRIYKRRKKNAQRKESLR
jgi:hypothetical protein